MIEQLISSDLAALAADSRGGIAALDSLLPDVRVEAEPARLLGLASAYADSVARIVWGATTLAFVVGVAVTFGIGAALAHPDGVEFNSDYIVPGRDFFYSWLRLEEPTTVIWLLLFGVLLAGTARRLATSRFGRLVGPSRDPVQAGSRLVSRLATWSIALQTVAIPAIAVLFTTTAVYHVVSPGFLPPWSALMNVHQSARNVFILVSQWHDHDIARLRDLFIAVPAIIAGGIWIARRRPRIFFDRRLGWSALAVALLAAGTALWLGDADTWFSPPLYMGTSARFGSVRTIVMAVGAVALFVAIASSSLRRTRTE